MKIETKNNLKRVIKWITVIVVVLSAMLEIIVATQALPFVAYWVLATKSSKGVMVKFPMLMLAGLMMLLNAIGSAPFDFVVWLIIFALYADE